MNPRLHGVFCCLWATVSLMQLKDGPFPLTVTGNVTPLIIQLEYLAIRLMGTVFPPSSSGQEEIPLIPTAHCASPDFSNIPFLK